MTSRLDILLAVTAFGFVISSQNLINSFVYDKNCRKNYYNFEDKNTVL